MFTNKTTVFRIITIETERRFHYMNLILRSLKGVLDNMINKLRSLTCYLERLTVSPFQFSEVRLPHYTHSVRVITRILQILFLLNKFYKVVFNTGLRELKTFIL